MKAFLRVPAMAFPLLMLAAAVVQGGIPCPDLCTVEAVGDGDVAPEAAVCPQGDFDGVIVTVTAIDCLGEPVPGMEVTVYPDPDITGFCFCPGEETKVDSTDLAGIMTVVFERFAGCGELRWYAEGRGVIMPASDPIFINSADFSNGDCQVNLSDFVYFAGRYQGADPCCDFNRDGSVSLTDFIGFAAHYGDACQ
jgi:hypothetical protein